MLHSFDRKNEQQLPSNLTTGSAITDKDRDDLEPGGSRFTPNVVFATDRVEYTSTKSSLLIKTLAISNKNPIAF